MWADDIVNKGYEIGTFKIGQSVYCIKNVIHRFSFHKKCVYCDNTGKVFLKSEEFVCPACHGVLEAKEVTEKVVGETTKIKSIVSLKNRNKSLEVYTSEPSGNGLIIRKQDNGENTYFSSYEEAQKICDEYNKRNNVEILLDEYKRQEIKEQLLS